MAERMAALLLAFLLDLCLGDPAGRLHPVCLIGRLITRLEAFLRRRGGDLRRSALVLTVVTVCCAMAAAQLLTLPLLGLLRPLRIAGFALLFWPGLSARVMMDEAKGVRLALAEGLIPGRKGLARIVGRDTESLSEREILCAAVETVAENTTDGVTSPMFYALLGGPALLWGFKAASTLDSMVGYLDERWRDIGWSSARLDDLLGLVPARLTGLLMCLSAFLCGLDGRNALRILRRDHANHLSPNCAWTEATAAGALHIRLGGPHDYFGRRVDKPSIGDDDRAPVPEDIQKANRLLLCTSLLFLGLLGVLTRIIILFV